MTITRLSEIKITEVLNGALLKLAAGLTEVCIQDLGQHYGFDPNEAIEQLGLKEICVATKPKAVKAVKIKAVKIDKVKIDKPKTVKTVKVKIDKPNKPKPEIDEIDKPKPEKRPSKRPSILLPWTGEICHDWCYGVRLNSGLYTQCTQAKLDNKKYCNYCYKQSETNESGEPTYGCIQDRLKYGLNEYKEPKQGKSPTAYFKIMKRLNITREQAIEEAAKFNLTIPEEQFIEPTAIDTDKNKKIKK